MSNVKNITKRIEIRKNIEELRKGLLGVTGVLERIKDIILGNNQKSITGLLEGYDKIDIRSLALYRILVDKKLFLEEEFLKETAKIQEEIVKAKEDFLNAQYGLRNKTESEVVENGDVVTLNINGTMDGKGFAGDKINGLNLVVGEKLLFPGFTDDLVGKKQGEDVEFSKTIPDDFLNREIAGKLIVYKVKILKVRAFLKKEENVTTVQSN